MGNQLIKIIFHRKHGWIEFLSDDKTVPAEQVPPPIQFAAREMMPAYADGESVTLEISADGSITVK